jgi:hypothetical protein
VRGLGGGSIVEVVSDCSEGKYAPFPSVHWEYNDITFVIGVSVVYMWHPNVEVEVLPRWHVIICFVFRFIISLDSSENTNPKPAAMKNYRLL